MIWLSILYLFICLYIHLSSIYLSIYPSFHSFIYWIIINTFLLTTSRCLSILLSLWLHNYLSSPATARKICLYIQQFFYLSISSNKSIYLHGYKSIYFSKEHFLRHPVLLSFSMYVICMSSVGLLRANAPQSTCLSIGLQRRLDSSKQLSPL